MSVARYIDPASTIEVTVQGVVFTIGYWPPLQGERINLALTKLRRMSDGTTIDLATADPDTAFAAIGLNRGIAEDAVRYSVRSWVWEGAKPAALVDGVLSEQSVAALRLSGVLFELSFKCMDFNTVSEAEKKS